MKRTRYKNMPLCECGCGNPVNKITSRFLPHHNLRIPLTKEIEDKRRQKISKTMRVYFAEHPDVVEILREKSTGRKHSEETKKKLSIMRKGIGNGMYGKKVSEETIKKQLEARKGYRHSEETKAKISKANKGKPRSKKLRKHLSEKVKDWHKTHDNSFKGKHHSIESKKKMSLALKGKYINEKASNWQGGKSAFPYAVGWNQTLREKIKERDLHLCQNPLCDHTFLVLDVHHIDYDKQNNKEKNLITLCKRCHGKTQKNRKYWIKYYQDIMGIYRCQK